MAFWVLKYLHPFWPCGLVLGRAEIRIRVPNSRGNDGKQQRTCVA